MMQKCKILMCISEDLQRQCKIMKNVPIII